MFKRMNSTHPLNDVARALVVAPALEDKIFGYLLGIDWSSAILDRLEEYLMSADNIYQSVEIAALRLLLLHRVPDGRDRQRVIEIGERFFYRRAGVDPMTWYSNILGAYLIGKYGSLSQLTKALKHAASAYHRFSEPLARRHLAYLSFAAQPQGLAYKEFIAESQRDPDRTVQSIWQFDSALTSSELRGIPKELARKINIKKLYSPGVAFFPWTMIPLLHRLARRDEFHTFLKPRLEAVMAKNQDTVVQNHLSLIHAVVS
jgi:hypothetical protein